MHEKTSRLTEYEKEKELTKLRDLLVDKRMVHDTNLPRRRTVRSLVEISPNILQMSPHMQKALNFDAIKETVVKKFDFQVKDVVNYMLGRKELLFSKLKVVDPEGFEKAKKGSDMSEFTHQELELSQAEDPMTALPKNDVQLKDYRKGILNIFPETQIEKYDHAQIYLTDGYSNIESEYDYVEDLKFKGIPFENHQFQRLQYLLYNGVNNREMEFRQIFLNHLIEDFEKEFGPLTWAQRSNIVAQFEEEIFDNYDHLNRLEDVLENLEQDYGFFKKFKKEVSIDWVDQEIQKARALYLQLSPEQVRKQREFVETNSREHRKFIQIGRN